MHRETLTASERICNTMRSRVWIVIDCLMLVAVVALQTWRLTGVPLHEEIGVALLAAVLAHLLLHWPWVASRSRRILQPRTTRTRINFSLNVILFVTMTAAMVSGLAISKVVVPMHPSADLYLKWHGIHDTSSRLMLLAAALHLAMNWDRLVARRPRFRFVLRPAMMIAAAIAVVGGAVYAIEQIEPRPDITLITREGRRIEHAAPPREIAALRKDTVRPSSRGVPPFLLQGAVAGVVAVIGRKVLRLRLD
jgi:uncharacterized protein DUF4405